MRKVLPATAPAFFVMFLVACAQPPRTASTDAVQPTPEGQLDTPLSIGAPTPTQISSIDSWIEIDLAEQVLVLHKDGQIAAEYPVSTGVTDDPKYATPPGLYKVQSKFGREGLIDAPLMQLIPGSRAAGPARTVLCGQSDNLIAHAAARSKFSRISLGG